MTFEIVNFRCCRDTHTLLATADIQLDRQVIVCNVKLIRRKDGSLAMAMPTKKEGTRYLPEILVVDSLLRAEMEQALVNRYTR